MRPSAPALAMALVLGFVPTLAWGQAEPPVAPPPTPKPTSDAPAETPPAVAEVLVIPLRVHILSAPDVAAVDCHLSDDDIRRIVGKVNRVWRPAGIHWALDPIMREPAARLVEFQAQREAQRGDPLGPFRLLAPDASRSERGIDVYYIHQFSVNGVFLGNRTAFVQETAKLRPVPGGIDEPLPRVTAHELGHALGLPHRQDRTNLLASGTTGTSLNQAEVDRVRSRAPSIPGTRSVLDLSHDRDEARAKKNDTEANRLDTILRAIEATESLNPLDHHPSPANP